jgi:hypothetical protein
MSNLITCECGHTYKQAYKYRHDKRDVHIMFFERKAKIEEYKRQAKHNKDKRKCLLCHKQKTYRTDYCLKHINELKIEIDLIFKCYHCKSAHTRSGFVMDGFKYCRTCFYFLFPEHKLSIKNTNYCSKERKVKNALATQSLDNKIFSGFVHNKPMLISDCKDCTVARRIDFRKQINNTLLCIEVDENGHCGYDKKSEDSRYNEIIFAYTCNYIFIRFNPDRTRKDRSTLNQRLPSLYDEIIKQTNRILNGEATDLLEKIYMFYPTKQ